MLEESTVETVCLLSNRKCASSEPKSKLASDLGERRDSERSLLDFVNLKPDAYVDLSLDMEEYYEILDRKTEKKAAETAGRVQPTEGKTE